MIEQQPTTSTEQPPHPRRRFLHGAVAAGVTAAAGVLAARSDPAHAQGSPHEDATTNVHGISDTSKLTLLDQPNTFTTTADLKLLPGGDSGEIRLGIDGADGRASFAGTTMPQPCESLRITHPNDPKPNDPGHSPGPVDMHIVPYNSGMAIDFKGLVECWVEEWSIHNNNRGGGLIGDEARLWVGNNLDTGGILMTAHNTLANDPRDRWVRFISRKFHDEEGNGPMQFIVRDPLDFFSFGHGPTGVNPGQVGNPTETLRITSDGAIGSGTTSPLARLHLAEPGGAAARLEDVGGGSSEISQEGGAFVLRTFGPGGATTGVPLRIDTATGTIEVSGTLRVTGDLQTSGDITAGGHINAAGNVAAEGSVHGGNVAGDAKADRRGIVVFSPNGKVKRRIGIDNKGRLKVSKP